MGQGMRLVLIAAFMGLLAILPAAAQGVTVETAIIEANGTATRVTFELSAGVEPLSVFTLAADSGRPHRVVIDLPEVTWAVEEGTTLSGRGLVQQIRYGRNRPGRSRIVLDLLAPVTITEQLFSDRPAQIVMALVPANEEAFAAVSGFPEAQANGEAYGPPAPTPIPSEGERAFQDIAQVLASLGETPSSSEGASTDAEPPRRTRPIIVIDPGHGGRDPGMVAVNGRREKDIVLDIGRAVRDALNETELFDAFLTRETDLFLQLNDRYAIAQELEADLFISIHVDSNDNDDARGATIYTLSENASDEEAARVAARENQSDAVAGYVVDEELTRILIDLAQRETMNLSAELAAMMVESFGSHNVHTVSRPHRFAGFRVLTAPDVPSVLIETGFGTNRQDAALLGSDRYKQALGRSLTEALIYYFDMGGVGESWLAQNTAVQN